MELNSEPQKRNLPPKPSKNPRTPAESIGTDEQSSGMDSPERQHLTAGWSRGGDSANPSTSYDKFMQHKTRWIVVSFIIVVAFVGGGVIFSNTFMHSNSNANGLKVDTFGTKTIAVGTSIVPSSVIYKPIDSAQCPAGASFDSPQEMAIVSIVECDRFLKLSIEKQEKITRLEHLSNEDFVRQPFADQLMFANFLFENRSAQGRAAINPFRIDQGTAQFGVIGTYLDVQVSETPDKPAMENLSAALATILFGTATSSKNGPVVNRTIALDMLSGISVPGSPFYLEMASVIKNSTSGIFDVNGRSGKDNYMIYTDIMNTPNTSGTVVIGGNEYPRYSADVMQTVGNPASPEGMVGNISVGLGVHTMDLAVAKSLTIGGLKTSNWLIINSGPIQK